MFMAAWMTREDVVNEYWLKAEESAFVFSQLKSLSGDGRLARYAKEDVERAIASLRRHRPPKTDWLFVGEEEDSKMIDVREAPDTDLAGTIREIFDWLKPRIEGAFGAIKPPEESQRMLTPQEASKVMRLNVQTVMAWCREGRLTASKIGRNWLIPREAIEEHLRRHQLIHGRTGK